MYVKSVVVFFFFKQKTAYEMRISDWSSDVCSSDLPGRDLEVEYMPAKAGIAQVAAGQAAGITIPSPGSTGMVMRSAMGAAGGRNFALSAIDMQTMRSEEHTSELQSLMRISYAVFCLKKKTYKTNTTTSINRTPT